MPKLQSLEYQTWDGLPRVLDFIGAQPIAERFHTTVLTGKNGSHKSTILRELVSALCLAENRARLSLVTESLAPHVHANVICASGSVADRFPVKENGGRATAFAVPEYVYLGQRVGANLLSKKRPLETAVAFALDENFEHRYEHRFYEKAFQLAGIVPSLDLTFGIKPSAKAEKDLLGEIQKIARSSPLADSPTKGRSRTISPSMARHLLEEFTYDDFSDLQSVFTGRGRGRPRVNLGESGATSHGPIGLNAIRLGLVADVLALDEAQVTSRRHSKPYSIFELSSGEYHMLTTTMGLGFSVRSDAVVLIDEPENSLHPQWQQEMMEVLFDICDSMVNGHLVVSTHSPLIVSGARAGSTVVDLGVAADGEAISASLYGASADEILFEQFGIASSRNRQVVDVVQRAVELIERGEGSDPSFHELEAELSVLRGRLRDGDPLVDVIEALLEENDRRD